MPRSTLFALLMLGFGLTFLSPRAAFAQDMDMVSATPANATFVPIPGLPRGADFHVLYGDPTEAFGMFFRLQPGVTVPMHFHTSAERMVGVEGAMVTEFDDGRKVKVSAGVYLFIPGKSPHAATCPGGGQPCIAYLYFDEAFDITWIGETPANLNPIPES